MKRPTLSNDTLEIVPKDRPLVREPTPEMRESGREPVEVPPTVVRQVLTCRMPEPLLDRLSEAAHHYRKRYQKQDLIEQALDAWLTAKGF
jgi:hypothetical protein